jgi:hypothetical protein
MNQPIASVLMLVLSAGALAAQEATHPVAGCYELSVDEWSNPWPPEWHPPLMVQLDTLSAAVSGVRQRDGLFAMRPAVPFPRRRGGGGSSWEFIGADSIRVNWAGDYAGLNMYLELGGEVLHGWVRGFTDVGRPAGDEPRSTVAARRVTCPAQLETPL